MLLVTKIRKEQGISQAELARRANVNQTSMSRIESGKEAAYPFRGKRIADALGWNDDPAKLFEEVREYA